MLQDHNYSAEELIQILSSAASYNDKGYAWSSHDKNQQEHFRAELQAKIIILTNRLGKDVLGGELFEALISGVAVRDSSGKFVSLAQTLLIPN